MKQSGIKISQTQPVQGRSGSADRISSPRFPKETVQAVLPENNLSSKPWFKGKGFLFKRFFQKNKSFTRIRRFGFLPVNGYVLLALYFIAVLSTGITQSNYLDMIREREGSVHDLIARQLGFGLEKTTITGIKQLHISEILTAAQISPKGSLPFLSVDEARMRLERLPLVKKASIRKLYPDQVVISVEERTPHAIWQNDGELYIIAADGTVIDLMQDERFLSLPFVVGFQANEKVDEYLSLLNISGRLKNRITAGTLVAGRRWTLKMDNGIDVCLPETDPESAIKRLELLEETGQILSKDILVLDLRIADRVTIRLSAEAAAERIEKNKNKITKGRGVQT